MKKLLLLLIAFFCLVGAVHAQSDSALAKAFIRVNADGQFDKAQQYFAPALQSKVSPGMLQVVWKRYMKKYGTYNGVEKMRLISRDSVRTWMTDCQFEKALIRLAITFNSEHQLIGYRINRIIPERKPSVNPLEKDWTIAVSGGDIAGTLLLPKQPKENMPVVLIIPGSGPVDRDGNEVVYLHSNMYKMLAHSLAAHGIASFRYDKRGVGQSTGLIADDGKIHFRDYVNDAVAVARYLNRDSLFSKVILVGHSQGSLVGMLVAQQVDVGGFMSLEGAGEDVGKVLLWQLAANKSEVQRQQLKKKLDSLKAGFTVSGNQQNPIFNPADQPLITSWMKYDPAQEIQKLSMPVLIINGTTDLQVPVNQAKKLAGADPAARLKIIRGMNHILKTAPEERTINLGTYNKPDLPITKDLVVEIVSFINSL